MTEPFEMIARVLLAGFLGAMVGFERESTGQAAGIRTHALVSLGACLFTVVGSEAFGAGADSSRVAAQVVTGIGFVGAGAIMRNGMSVRGLTTAATLWVSGALGLAAGAGAYLAAAVGGASVLLIVTGLRRAKPLAARASGFVLRVEYETGHGTLGPILRSLEEAGARVMDLDIRDNDTSTPPLRHVEIRAISDEARLADLVAQLDSRGEVHTAIVEPVRDLS